MVNAQTCYTTGEADYDDMIVTYTYIPVELLTLQTAPKVACHKIQSEM